MEKVSRRTILKGLRAFFVMLAVPFSMVRTAFAERFPTRTVEKENFTFNPTDGLLIWTDQQTSEPYKLVIDGMVRKPVQLSYSDLRKLPSVTQVNDFHCVEGWTMPRVEWSGFRFRELLNLVEPLGGAEYVTFHSLGETRYKPHGQAHYVESFKLSSLLDDDQELLMTLGKDGKPLSQDRGAPLRVIAPFRLAYKSIKFVHRIEFSKKKQLGWWTLENPVYSWEGHIRRKAKDGTD
jgi:DMSO/TMAO reductase YedYZ molybdopterin-dependent catalytic subunit